MAAVVVNLFLHVCLCFSVVDTCITGYLLNSRSHCCFYACVCLYVRCYGHTFRSGFSTAN